MSNNFNCKKIIPLIYQGKLRKDQNLHVVRSGQHKIVADLTNIYFIKW